MWLFHVYSCMGISDTNLYYEKMASKGFVLKKSNYYADNFTVGECENIYFSVMPKTYFTLSKKTTDTEWTYLTENRNNYIFISKCFKPCDMLITADKVSGSCIMNIGGLIFLPICFYYIINRILKIIGGVSGHCSIGLFLVTAVLMWMGVAWSTFIECYEVHNLIKRGSLLPYNAFRYFLSLGLSLCTNIAHIIFILLLLYGFVFLRMEL